MRYAIIIIVTIFLVSCKAKHCLEWYSYISAYTLTKKENNNEKIEGWYKTDFVEEELNFLIDFIYSADGYEGCDSKTMIHEVVKDSIYIYSEGYLIIDNDTIHSKTNLYGYFLLTANRAHYIFEYNKTMYGFPEFENSNNTFYFNMKLTDGTYARIHVSLK